MPIPRLRRLAVGHDAGAHPLMQAAQRCYALGPDIVVHDMSVEHVDPLPEDHMPDQRDLIWDCREIQGPPLEQVRGRPARVFVTTDDKQISCADSAFPFIQASICVSDQRRSLPILMGGGISFAASINSTCRRHTLRRSAHTSIETSC